MAGFILLIWFQLEDNAVGPVAALGWGVSALVLVYRGGRVRQLPWAAGALVAGSLTGLLAVVGTVALMIFKVGLHSHVYPDYLPGQMVGILTRAPLWAAAGALGGVGLALAYRALKP